MSSSKEFVNATVNVQILATGGKVSSRPMMGEHVVYYRDKVISGIHNDRLLVKVTPASQRIAWRPPMRAQSRCSEYATLTTSAP